MAAAAKAAGRDPGELTLVGITKTFPAEDARRLVRARRAQTWARTGTRRRGSEGSRACADLDLRWHFVGRLQTQQGPARSSRTPAVVHSARPACVSCPALGQRRSRPRAVAGAGCDALVQVSLDGDPGRGGAPADGGGRVADADRRDRAACDAGRGDGGRPAGSRPGTPRSRSPGPRDRRDAAGGAPGATAISAGMSADLEAAVAERRDTPANRYGVARRSAASSGR